MKENGSEGKGVAGCCALRRNWRWPRRRCRHRRRWPGQRRPRRRWSRRTERRSGVVSCVKQLTHVRGRCCLVGAVGYRLWGRHRPIGCCRCRWRRLPPPTNSFVSSSYSSSSVSLSWFSFTPRGWSPPPLLLLPLLLLRLSFFSLFFSLSLSLSLFLSFSLFSFLCFFLPPPAFVPI